MRTTQTLTPDDLSFVAEALIALCERSDSRPCYSDEGLKIKLKRAEWKDPIYGHLVRHQGEDPLLQKECDDVFTIARLTRRQSDVLLQRLEGWTFDEIGQAGKHTKQAAQNIFVQALKKIARAFRVYAYKGLSDVYRQETRRGVRKAGLGRIPQSAL
jgi:hypothetical protein